MKYVIIILFACCSQWYLQAQSATDSLLKMIAICKPDSVKAKLYLEAARKYYESTDYLNAKKFIDSSYAIAREINFTSGIIDFYFLDGRILKNTGKYYEAKYQYEEALSLSRESNDSARIAGSYNNLGNLLINLHDYPQALTYLRQSATIYQQIGELKKLAYPLSNIGKVHLDRKQYDSALYYYHKTISISQVYDDQYELAQTFKRIASIYTELGNYSKAFAYCDTSLAISEKYQYRYIIADVFEIQAKIYLAGKDYKNAKMKLLKCLELYHLLLVKPSIQYCYKQLSNLDTIEGNYRDAYRHYKMYHLYNDSLIDLENRIKFEKQRVSNKAEIQQLISDRKNKVLTILIFFLIITAILILYIFRQKQQTRQKLELAETKNKISRDLHDEIGSTLSSISMQTEVLKKRIKNHENIDDLVDLIKVESRKTMSTMSDIVWSLNSENENISELINRIRNYCSISLGTAGIHYHIDAELNEEVKNTDLHLFKEVYLISKEFINNSMKYAACKNVYVMLHKKGDLMNLVLKDDGVGFDVQNRNYNFGGEGIANMYKRAKSINATFDLQSARSEGTTLHLSWTDR